MEEQELLVDLARRAQGKYYGKYRGLVVSDQDPDQLGRLQLRVPSVMGTEVTTWALPCVPYGGLANQGWFVIPDVDAQVWVEFEEGDLRRPIWTGTFWQKSADVPTDAQQSPPATRLLQTASGHILQFDDQDQAERIRLHHKGGAELLIDENGSISVTDQSGNALTLDANAGKIRIEDTNRNAVTLSASGATIEDGNNNSVALGASGITLSSQSQIVLDGQVVLLGGAGGEPVIKGASFLALYATHIHTSVPTGGPTSPPIPQGETTTASTAVLTK